MAAKGQGRKKSRDVKRRKIQTKHQQIRRKQKKLQPRKQKKHQSRPNKRQVKRRAAKKAARSKQERKICSPRLFASKILRQMPKVRMEAKARGLVKSLLTDLYQQVATEVEALSQKEESPPISCTDVQNALKGAMEKELAKHTAAEPISSECA
ncbi:histone H2B.4-like [Varanus komodoensis]|uniref:histone H2B.4-like n=1 Tax=Varanus komodoensis TaxID=61221 RepID=UPI001CF7E788|nr:histone H2B.4-like [Varanus komodoensis]XP_044308063.1 histone H2B.4-like [Varanus komodoensis]